ncbi:MAG: DNA-binding response regulator [Isosphaera sp.]|nr:DNA-binding response regulator [Isosphaera sp.]
MTDPAEPTPPPIAVWVVEDNRALRRSVAAAIDAGDGMACAGAFGSCEAALVALETAPVRPRVVLMDIGLPGMSGIEGIRRFRTAATGSDVVVLTVFEDEDKILEAITAGASGFLLKGSRLDEVTAAIRLAAEGGSPMTPRVARRVLGFFAAGPASRPDYGLTEREWQILQLLAEGLAKKEIAGRLAISFHTVDMHLRHVYEKLHVTSATAAVAKAVREKLV